MEQYINQVIGTESDTEWWQMVIRAFIVFVVAIFLVRISNKRIFGKHSAFDIVLGFMLGSILSRAITGNSPFFQTLIAATVLVLLHRLMGFLAWRFNWFGTLIKGNHQVLIKDGKIQWAMMKEKNISEKDLREAVHSKGNVLDFDSVKYAFLERSGDISIIPKDKS